MESQEQDTVSWSAWGHTGTGYMETLWINGGKQEWAKGLQARDTRDLWEHTEASTRDTWNHRGDAQKQEDPASRVRTCCLNGEQLCYVHANS